ncbi:MAG: glycosyltransferase family 2 protein [Thermoleophilaceae bacterium]|nr:glycosyltransferase family 2 protein [Thermoleophilaceae bacterium]
MIRELTLLSVVAPMLNEEATARVFYDRVVGALGDLPFELVVVDDGSTDATPEILAELAGADERVKVITLSRRFGHQMAITAGLDHAAGDAVVMIDSDLQDPPEVVPEMLARWREGVDVVYAVRRQRAGETVFKRVTAKWFYRLMTRMAQVELTADAGDFRLLDRVALDALLVLRERNRYLRGMTAWIGYTQTAVGYDRDARYAGDTKYTLRRMVRFSLDAVASFSHVPLQIATLLGFLCAFVAFLGIPVAIGFRIAGEFVPGVTTVALAVLLLGGIQLIAVGMIGEYVGRIYDEVKGRPLYVVTGRHNLAAREVAEGEPAEAMALRTEREESLR